MIWLGALLGILTGASVEAWTIRARLRARRDARSPLAAIVGGFLARIGLLLLGTLLGAFTGAWSPTAYLLASASVLLLGEALAFALLRRSSSTTSRPTK